MPVREGWMKQFSVGAEREGGKKGGERERERERERESGG